MDFLKVFHLEKREKREGNLDRGGKMVFFPFQFHFGDLNEKLSTSFRPWHRSCQFWLRAADIYTGYKVRVKFVKDAEKQEEMWEKQHELAAEKLYSMCSELGGFFLKAAQILGKPDLAPAAWVKRLVTLCDRAPSTPFQVIKVELENEWGRDIGELFERFDADPVGSASIAQGGEKRRKRDHIFFIDTEPGCTGTAIFNLKYNGHKTPPSFIYITILLPLSLCHVHRARLRGSESDVAVKVQHPGVQDLMMTDICNLQAFALYLQKTDIKFDLFSVTKEIEKQVGYEFDFLREADAMERIRHFLQDNNKKVPVSVPHVIHDMLTRKVLVMEFIEGIPILNLGNEMAKRGISPAGKLAAMAKQKILRSLTLAYGQMILKSGFFHADPHPGNILVALLDYGQVKELPDELRLGYAKLIIAIADNDPIGAVKSYRDLGIQTLSFCADEQNELFKLAQTMFDTKLPPGVTVLSPFAEGSSIKKIGVQTFPEELFSILRTVHLLRGLSVGLGINYSCAEQWRPIAEEALYAAGRSEGKGPSAHKRGFLRK
ncbi:hypothetical protein ACLOJK_012093 [Asimina triloba]